MLQLEPDQYKILGQILIPILGSKKITNINFFAKMPQKRLSNLCNNDMQQKHNILQIK